MHKKILACITAFYPGEKFEEICAIIARGATYLLIVDNSPECTLSPSDFSVPDNAIIVYNQNRGALSGALNIALELARLKKFDYLHLFDQDTLPPADISFLLANTLEKHDKAIIAAPRFINSDTNFPGRILQMKGDHGFKNIWPDHDMGVIDVMLTITSGTVINMNLLPNDVIYDERLLVDSCDIDFCLNLKSRGFHIIVDTAQCMRHGLGNRKKGGSRWSALNYSPYRKYLTVKNREIVWRRYYKEYPSYVISDFFIFLLDSGRTIVFEKGRFKKLKAILKGLLHGIKEKDIQQRKILYNT
jgi:rhamnosyltransferase